MGFREFWGPRGAGLGEAKSLGSRHARAHSGELLGREFSCSVHQEGQAADLIFLELSCFFHDPEDAGNLISGFSAFYKTSLDIRKFMVHILLKPGLENFEHYFTSM